MKYERVIRAFLEQPWALHPQTLASFAEILRFRAGGERLTPEEISARIGDRRELRDPLCYYEAGKDGGARLVKLEARRAEDGAPSPAPVVGVIGIYGVIAQHAREFSDVSSPGGTSIEGIRKSLRAMLGEPSVQSIILDVDSPGGSVFGVEELAAEIRAAREQKPIYAIANPWAASAAYWLASAASELSVIPSGEVGSIGVYGGHSDYSKMLELEGIKVTLVKAGKYKTEGNPYEPLSEEAKAYMQKRIDEYYDAFVKSVATSRAATPAAVRNGFGQGRMVGTKEAVSEGMSDRGETFDDLLRRAANGGRAPKGKKAEELAPAPAAEGRELTAEELVALEELKGL